MKTLLQLPPRLTHDLVLTAVHKEIWFSGVLLGKTQANLSRVRESKLVHGEDVVLYHVVPHGIYEGGGDALPSMCLQDPHTTDPHPDFGGGLGAAHHTARTLLLLLLGHNAVSFVDLLGNEAAHHLTVQHVQENLSVLPGLDAVLREAQLVVHHLSHLLHLLPPALGVLR